MTVSTDLRPGNATVGIHGKAVGGGRETLITPARESRVLDLRGFREDCGTIEVRNVRYTPCGQTINVARANELLQIHEGDPLLQLIRAEETLGLVRTRTTPTTFPPELLNQRPVCEIGYERQGDKFTAQLCPCHPLEIEHTKLGANPVPVYGIELCFLFNCAEPKGDGNKFYILSSARTDAEHEIIAPYTIALSAPLLGPDGNIESMSALARRALTCSHGDLELPAPKLLARVASANRNDATKYYFELSLTSATDLMIRDKLFGAGTSRAISLADITSSDTIPEPKSTNFVDHLRDVLALYTKTGS